MSPSLRLEDNRPKLDTEHLMPLREDIDGDSERERGKGKLVAVKKCDLSLSLSVGEPVTRKSLTKRTQKCDIFSSGLVYFYVLIPGCHPFGQWYEREANIMKANSDLSPLSYAPDALDLIGRMLNHEPDNRPTASQVRIIIICNIISSSDNMTSVSYYIISVLYD